MNCDQDIADLREFFDEEHETISIAKLDRIRFEVAALRMVALAARLLVSNDGGISLELKHSSALDDALKEAGY